MAGAYVITGDVNPTGTGFPTDLNFEIPGLPAGYTSLFVFDSALGDDAMLANKVSGGLPALKIGAPAALDTGMTITPNNWFDTQEPNSAAETWIVVAKPRLTALGLLTFTGAWQGGISSAESLTVNLSGSTYVFRYQCQGAGAPGAPLSAPVVADEWNTIICGTDGTSTAVCGRGAGGTYVEGSAAMGTRTVVPGTVRVGGSAAGGLAQTTFTEPQSVLLFARYPSLLNSTQRAAAATAIRAWLSAAGFTGA